MQSFKNAVFSAFSNFLALASLRQAVRWACFSAASPAAAVAAGVVEAGVIEEACVSVEGVGVWGVAR